MKYKELDIFIDYISSSAWSWAYFGGTPEILNTTGKNEIKRCYNKLSGFFIFNTPVDSIKIFLHKIEKMRNYKD